MVTRCKDCHWFEAVYEKCENTKIVVAAAGEPDERRLISGEFYPVSIGRARELGGIEECTFFRRRGFWRRMQNDPSGGPRH